MWYHLAELVAWHHIWFGTQSVSIDNYQRKCQIPNHTDKQQLLWAGGQIRFNKKQFLSQKIFQLSKSSYKQSYVDKTLTTMKPYHF